MIKLNDRQWMSEIQYLTAAFLSVFGKYKKKTLAKYREASPTVDF